MKKVLFSLLAGAVMMSACSNQAPVEKQYVINGTVEGFEDGDTVMLVDLNNDSVEIQVVKDGKFTFTGTLDQAKPVFIEFDKDTVEPLSESAILLEDTIFTVKIVAGRGNNTIEGGPLQRTFREMTSSSLSDAVLIDSLKAKFEAAETSEAERQEIVRQVDSIGSLQANTHVDFLIARMPSEFSNVAAPMVAYNLGLIRDYVSDTTHIQRLLDAFAEKQPDAFYYQVLKKEIQGNK